MISSLLYNMAELQEEPINAIRYVSNDSLSKDDTIRAAANLMGYTRLGSVVLQLFTDAYKMAK